MPKKIFHLLYFHLLVFSNVKNKGFFPVDKSLKTDIISGKNELTFFKTDLFSLFSIGPINKKANLKKRDLFFFVTFLVNISPGQ